MQYLTDLVADLKEEQVFAAIKDELGKNTNPLDIIKACQDGMEIVGKRFSAGTYFLPELLIAGEMMVQAMELLGPTLKTTPVPTIGTIVLGTVKGDLHDIGKNIFKTMAEANGFEVRDLGVDVPPEKFVDAVNNGGVDIVGMSGLLTTVFNTMQLTMDKLVEAGLRDKVKVIIGGAPVDENVQKMVGADAHTRNASEGIEICKKFLEK